MKCGQQSQKLYCVKGRSSKPPLAAPGSQKKRQKGVVYEDDEDFVEPQESVSRLFANMNANKEVLPAENRKKRGADVAALDSHSCRTGAHRQCQ
jgi:hypothetical protein